MKQAKQMNLNRRGGMSYTDYVASLTQDAERHEHEAAKLRKAVAVLMNGDAPPTNGAATRIGKPPVRRDRAVRALTKHGPLSPSVLAAYVGVPRKQIRTYAQKWIDGGYVKVDLDTGRYCLPDKD